MVDFVGLYWDQIVAELHEWNKVRVFAEECEGLKIILREDKYGNKSTLPSDSLYK